MSSLLSMVILILFITLVSVNGDSQVATFSVSNTGIAGTVSVSNGWVVVDLDLSELELANIPNGADCFENGFTYHIHQVWNYDDERDRLYMNSSIDSCSSTWTAGHYDPWQGCGPSTGNQYCLSQNGCVPGSTALGGTTYNCTDVNFIANPYSCEVGDWSGKYGALFPNDNMKIDSIEKSFWEIAQNEAVNKSVVFHCADTNQRAFCAPFMHSTESTTDTISMNDDIDVAAYFDQVLSRNSRIEINTDGTVFIYIDGRSKTDDISQLSCGGQDIEYTIFETWNNDDVDQLYLTECNGGILGAQWDPTIQCIPFSGSEYCTEGKLCQDENYEYECDWSQNRYSCSPSDLSGKFGTVNANELSELAYSSDNSLSPSTEELLGRSIAIHCQDSQMLACAKIVEQTDNAFIYNNVFVVFMFVILINFIV